MKTKINLDDDLPLNKMLELHIMTIVVRAIFHEDNKYSLQACLNEWLHKL